MQETWVQSLGQEDPLEKGTVIPQETVWDLPVGVQESAKVSGGLLQGWGHGL